MKNLAPVKWGALAVGGVLVLLGVIGWGYSRICAGVIYSGVTVQGIALGTLSPERAAALLEKRLGPPPQTLEVRAADQRWTWGWEVTGRGYDAAATARVAYAVGRGPDPLENVGAVLRALVVGEAVAPRVAPADPTRVQAALEQAAPALLIPAVDARLEFQGSRVITATGQAGRRLDVAASTERVLAALAGGASTVELVLETVPPQVASPEPAASLAQRLMSRPFTLVVDDPLTDYRMDFSVPPEQVATWLRARRQGERLGLVFDRAAVQGWLDGVGPQLGEERQLDSMEVLPLAMAALATGQSQVQPRIRHPERRYVVQPGDMLSGISFLYGMPKWRIEAANPDIEADAIDVGMELVIPSIDVLFPEPLVPGKRIEVDLTHQTLRAFENEAQIFEFKISSGMSSTPTLSGQFQILMKEKDAFARRWRLDMPYFMGFYLEGPNFYNGFHELPITAWGSRLSPGVLGWPASFGCIILNTGDAETLYNWAPVGTLVRVTGMAPVPVTNAGTLDVLIGQDTPGETLPGVPEPPPSP